MVTSVPSGEARRLPRSPILPPGRPPHPAAPSNVAPSGTASCGPIRPGGTLTVTGTEDVGSVDPRSVTSRGDGIMGPALGGR